MSLKWSLHIYNRNLCNKFGTLPKQHKKINHSFWLHFCPLINKKNANQNNPLIAKLLNKLNTIRHSKKGIICWIPSHFVIERNEKADSLAKTALNMAPNQNAKIPYTDLKHKMNTTMTQKWQQLKDKNTDNKLYQIESILKERKLNPNNTRRKETTLARLCIRHTRLAHSFILK